MQKTLRIAAFFFCILPSAFCIAKNGAYRSTAHGDPLRGPQRRLDVPRGSCLQCHEEKVSGDNNFCFTCHTDTMRMWSDTAHVRCVDCHDPHGVRDRQGIVPALLIDRQSRLCVTCHDGTRAADVRTQLNRSYVHGASCSDCHNVHQVSRNPAPSFLDDSSKRFATISRVEVINGGAGVVPAYRFVAAGDPGDPTEFEICFKCHSSFVKQTFGQSDIARLTNPANPSFHPIQGAGRNARIDPNSFVNGFDAESRVTCGDCHEPHASSHRYLLRKSQDELCFDCHARAVYADVASGDDVVRATRFQSHALHTVAQKIACSVCHETHGSTRNPALIATGRFPGITSYIPTPAGATCTTSCHALKTYKRSDSR